MKNFWTSLPRPFFALAPMEDVTDAAFRALIAELGKPDVMFTEFVSADGLILAGAEGQKKLQKKLQYSEAERPIVAQIFSAVPEHIEQASRLLRGLGFDGVDINMGCPDRVIEKSNCGAALMKNPVLARALLRAAKTAGLPVSVKTRLGYNTDQLETWLPELLAEEPAAITIHARTRKEMSAVPARFDRIARAVEIRDAFSSPTRIIGNGDVRDMTDARTKAQMTKCDGVMLGRAIFGNPWLFATANNPEQGRGTDRLPQEKVRALSRHLELFDELLSDTTNFAVMKKHFKSYISGWDGAKEMRIRLMGTNGIAEAKNILRGILPE